jgi:hypothetical protein
MKRAVIETAAVCLRCPICDVMLRKQDGQETWLREDLDGDRHVVPCHNCKEQVEIPKYGEVWPW